MARKYVNVNSMTDFYKVGIERYTELIQGEKNLEWLHNIAKHIWMNEAKERAKQKGAADV